MWRTVSRLSFFDLYLWDILSILVCRSSDVVKKTAQYLEDLIQGLFSSIALRKFVIPVSHWESSTWYVRPMLILSIRAATESLGSAASSYHYFCTFKFMIMSGTMDQFSGSELWATIFRGIALNPTGIIITAIESQPHKLQAMLERAWSRPEVTSFGRVASHSISQMCGALLRALWPCLILALFDWLIDRLILLIYCLFSLLQ